MGMNSMFSSKSRIECFDKKDIAFVYESGYFRDTPIIVVTNESEPKYKGYCITLYDAINRVIKGDSRFVKMYMDSEKTDRLVFDSTNDEYMYSTFKSMLNEKSKKRFLSKAIYKDMSLLPALEDDSLYFDLPYTDKLGIEYINNKISEGEKLFNVELRNVGGDIGINVKFIKDYMLLSEFNQASKILKEVSEGLEEISIRGSNVWKLRRAMMEILGDYLLYNHLDDKEYKVYDASEDCLMKVIKDGMYDNNLDDFKSLIMGYSKKE